MAIHEHPGIPPLGFDPQREAAERLSGAKSASQIYTAEKMAFMRGLATSPAPTSTKEFEPKAPNVADDFAERVNALGANVEQNGIGVDRAKVLELGKTLFARLLELDKVCRSEQRVIGGVDLTDFAAVYQQFARMANVATRVPERSMAEQLNQIGRERDAFRGLAAFSDLWKLYDSPREVREILALRRVLESLLFGRSILARTGEDNRCRSRFFLAGLTGKNNDSRLTALADWRGTFVPANPGDVLVSIELIEPLGWGLVWLAEDSELQKLLSDPSTDIGSLFAQEFYGVRRPTVQQVRTAKAVFGAYLRGLDVGGASDAPLLWSWNFVGRKIQADIDFALLAKWREELGKRFPAIKRFYENFIGRFLDRDGYDFRAVYRFAPVGYHQYVDDLLAHRFAYLCGVIAVAVNDMLADSKTSELIAVLPDQIVLETSARGVVRDQLLTRLRESISVALSQAFPGSDFRFTIEQKETL